MTKGFDSRIKSIKDIQTVITADQSLVGQTGYFENSVSCFSDLKNCRYGKLTKLYEYGDCINEYCFECDNSTDYEFFIPESVLKTEEKKYIPFSLSIPLSCVNQTALLQDSLTQLIIICMKVFVMTVTRYGAILTLGISC